MRLSRSVASSWADPACGASLRASSARECSRRASSRSARALSSAAFAGGEVLNLFLFRRLRGRRSGLGDARLFADLRFDLAREPGVFLQEVARVVLALPQPVAAVDVPGARLLEHAEIDADLEYFAFARNAVAVHDVELGLLEGRRHLVLHHLDARLGADHLVALLDRADPADVHAHRGIELERIEIGRAS